MFKKSIRRRVPELNTTSTADISFMLLIFFLVTSSMDTDKGLSRQLPSMQKNPEQEEMNVKARDILNVNIDDNNVLWCDGKRVTLQQLTVEIESFVDNRDNKISMPEKYKREIPLLGVCQITAKHIISVQTDRNTSYNAYFDMQNAIVKGYNNLRNKLSQKKFGHSYDKCSSEERDAVNKYYPQRISEAEPQSSQSSQSLSVDKDVASKGVGRK